MKLSVESFRGEVPRLTPRELPDNAAQAAVNARLQSGDLQSWRQFVSEKVLANSGPVHTEYLLKDKWLSWNEQVDVARSVLPGDTTFRVFLTCPALYATPRWTDYALATTGAEPYPVVTRPLGVPGPDTAPTLVVGVDTSDAAAFSVDVTDSGGTLAQWTISAKQYAHGGATEVNEKPTGVDATPCYELLFDDDPGAPAFMYRDFGISAAAVVSMSFAFKMTSGSGNYAQMCAGIMRAADGGDGIVVSWDKTAGIFYIGRSAPGWGVLSNATLVSATTPITLGLAYSCDITVTTNNDNTQTVKAVLRQGVTELANIKTTGGFTIGNFCGFMAETTLNDGVDRYRTLYDDIHVRASGTAGYLPANVATNYVYTYVNDIGQESAPSPATATILRPDGVSVTVTTPTTVSTAVPGGTDPDYGIATKRIYRNVTGAGGTLLLLVAEIPLAQADYIDVLKDNEVGPAVLESADWDVPPPTLEGIRALPNGMMAGYFLNQLCVSVQDRPHAWRVKDRKTTDTDINGINNIDTTVVVGTASYVYTASGNTNDAFSMSQPGEAQACVSKLGMVFLDGIGVVFPSPDGYQVCAGSASNVSNLTKGIFTKRQWEALQPSTIIAAVHDSVLHFFYDTGAVKSGYAIDATKSGFGLIQLAYHACAVHTNPRTDYLYLVLDVVSEPTDVLLPVASTAVTPTGHTIFRFDADPASAMVFRWRSKLYQMPYPVHMAIAQVMAERVAGYDNLVYRVFGNGVMLYERRVADGIEFTLPMDDACDEYEHELVGTSTAMTMQAAEDVMELT